jgi:hypothetical protein
VPPPKKTADAPLTTSLVPDNTVSQLPPEVPAAPKSHAVSWVLGGVGVAALGAAVALFVVGASTQAAVNGGTAGPDGRVRSGLSGSQAQAAADSASVQLGLGGAAAAVGLGLGATAVVLW